jgi:hypothetical protein
VEREDLRKESLSADYNAVYWQQRYTLRTEVPHFLVSFLMMLRARWVTRISRWVTLRARWVTLRACWVTTRPSPRSCCAPVEAAISRSETTLLTFLPPQWPGESASVSASLISALLSSSFSLTTRICRRMTRRRFLPPASISTRCGSAARRWCARGLTRHPLSTTLPSERTSSVSKPRIASPAR